MLSSNRRNVAVLLSCALLASVARPSFAAGEADSFPNKTVRLVIGFSAGGGSDVLARQLGSVLSEMWSQPVIVENRPGANGTIAATYVSRAAPDGYTLLLATNPHTMPPVGGSKLPYDPVKSFSPVSLMATKPMILISNPSFPANSIQELIALAKAKPGQLNYGTDGPASNPSMFMRMMLQQTGLKMTEVSYHGGGETLKAVLSGEVHLTFTTPQAGLEQIKSGAVKALAVTTNVRSVSLPNVPTLAEGAGLPNFNEGSWNGLLAPPSTPKAIVDKLSSDMIQLLKKPVIAKSFQEQGIVSIGSTPEEFTSFLSAEVKTLTELFRTLDAK